MMRSPNEETEAQGFDKFGQTDQGVDKVGQAGSRTKIKVQVQAASRSSLFQGHYVLTQVSFKTEPLNSVTVWEVET